MVPAGPGVKRVLVTSRSFSDGAIDLNTRAREAGLTIEMGPSHHSLDELRPLLKHADAWIAGTGPVSSAHLDAAPQLKIVARYGVGVESVDLAAAQQRGVLVTNTPGANSDAVADLTLALMLAALRHVTDGDRRLRSGDWTVRRGRELGALTVGLVGFGRIGQGVARRVSGFGSTMCAADPYAPDAVFESHGVKRLEVEDVFRHCDVVSLHAPGGHLLVNEERVRLMRKDALLVNTARADLVDEGVVAQALREGRLGGFAADTLAGDTRGDESPLLAPDIAAAVTLTPHWGAQTIQAVDNMGSMALDNVIAALTGETPPHLIMPSTHEEKS